MLLHHEQRLLHRYKDLLSLRDLAAVGVQARNQLYLPRNASLSLFDMAIGLCKVLLGE